MELNENHVHSSDLANKFNCPICKEISTKKKTEDGLIFKSPVNNNPGYMATPHKRVDGVLRACNNAECKICNQTNKLSGDIIYYLDLPGPCPRCGDSNCSEGIDRVRTFKLKD